MSVDSGTLNLPFFFSLMEHDEVPSDFLGNGWEYGQRINIAKQRIVRTIRFLCNTQQGIGHNLEVRGLEPALEALATFIDNKDARRSHLVRKQRGNPRPKLDDSFWITSPECIRRRRRALFSLDDLGPTVALFYTAEEIETYAYEPFLDWMRWRLFFEALTEMFEDKEIGEMNDVWYLTPKAREKYRTKSERREKRGRRKKVRIKNDMRPFHGKPGRDRKRGKQVRSAHAHKDRQRAAA